MSSEFQIKKEELERDLKKIKDSLKELKEKGGEEFEKEVSNLKTTAQDIYNSIKGKAEQGIEEFKSKVPEIKESINHQLESVSDDAKEIVKKNPIEALTAAGIIGLLIGILIGRK